MDACKWAMLLAVVSLCNGQRISKRPKIGLHQVKLRHMSPCDEKDLSCVEERLRYEIRKSEDKMSMKIDHKIKRLNQTLLIEHLEEVMVMMNDELQSTKEEHVKKDKTIGDMKDTLERQQMLITSLVNDVRRLSNSLQLVLKGGLHPGITTEATNLIPELVLPRDCDEIYHDDRSVQRPGHYYMRIQPESSPKPFHTCCKMTNTSGWTLLQRRQDGAVDFFRTWKEYKDGFGNLEGEFWLGNDRIHEVTSQGDYRLRIEMTDYNDKKYWAEYDHFFIDNEDELYRIHVSGYHGNAGDSLTSAYENHDGQAFSTKDADHDERFYDSCAENYRGAWWFKNCFESHLNGVYYHRGQHDNFFVRNGIQWNTIHIHSSLKHVEMMVRPNDSNDVA